MNDSRPNNFDNKILWENEVKEYLQNGAAGEVVQHLWGYFKHCLITENRFFFNHPLLETIIGKLLDNVIHIPKGTTLYRARIDESEKVTAETSIFYLSQSISLRKDDWIKLGISEDEYSKLTDDVKEMLSNSKYEAIRDRVIRGFNGFDAKECGAPPYYLVNEGRCNPPNVPFLYTAKEKHTAIAEVRPYIRDIVSLATVKPIEELKLVNFFYEYDGDAYVINDMLFHCIRMEFSKLNKGDKDAYLVTQYITALVRNLGLDGICFRSSLVENGTNYVIIDSEKCNIMSSDLFQIGAVNYNFFPVLNR